MVVVVHRDVVVGGGAFPDGNVASHQTVVGGEGLGHSVTLADGAVAENHHIVGGVGVEVGQHELEAVNRHLGIGDVTCESVPDGVVGGAIDGGLPGHQCGVGGDLADVDIQRF